MKIGQFDLEEKVLIVAEIGNNHEGNFEVAKKLVREAANCGVDAVKFQTFKTEHYVSHSDTARFERLKSFELSDSQFSELAELARSLGLMFFSTPLDLPSANFLNKIVDSYKIASCDNNFYPLLETICQTGKPIILSSGIVDLEQIQASQKFIETCWQNRKIDGDLAILHCVSSYPVPPEQANLLAIPFMRDRLQTTIGYSDHTIGIDACLSAVAIGAKILEKHFTLDHHYSDFRDHQLSADPSEMKQLVEGVAKVKSMLGKPEKVVQPCEVNAIPLIRRSIAAARSLPQGHQLELDDLMWIRPGTGLPPGEENKAIGKTLKRSLEAGELIDLADLEK